MMGTVYGYGVAGHETPFYRMTQDVEGLTNSAYGAYVGFYYSITFLPCMLLAGHLTEKWNRTLMVGVSCFTWGILTFSHCFVSGVRQLYLLRMLLGVTQSLAGPPIYSL